MATTPPPEEGGCDECYMLGVLFALAGSSFQALGLSLWKLHHVKTEKAEEQRLARVRAREERIEAYHNKQTQDDDSSVSHSKQRDTSDDITEDSASNAGEQRISVTGTKDGKPLSDIDEEEEQHPSGLCAQISWIWVIGFIIFAIGNGGDFIALGITKQSVVTLVGSWALVVNTFTARCLLQEIVHPLDILSSVLIIAGIVLTVLFSGQDSPEWPLERIIEQYQKPPVVIMLVILASMTFVGLSIMHIDYVKRSKEAKANNTLIAKPSRAIGALYCIVGSLVADFTVLFGKAFSGLLLPTLTGDNQFTSPFVVLIVLVFCVSLPSQIYLIDQSLTVNDALYHIPNFYVFWNVGSIVTGAIYYEEMANFGLANWLGFFSGVGVLFLGVYLTNIAAGKKQAMLEEKDKKRIEEEWMGGAGNEDGLRQVYDEEQRYGEMWEQHAGQAKEGGKQEHVTDLDEHGQECGALTRPASAAVSQQGSLRDVTVLERSESSQRQLADARRGQLTTPETVDEGDEEVMENLMRTLRDATGSDDEELPEDAASTPCALRPELPPPLASPAHTRSPQARPERAASDGSQYGSHKPTPMPDVGSTRSLRAESGLRADESGDESATSPATVDESAMSPATVASATVASATLVGDAQGLLAPRHYDGEEEERSMRVPSALEYMPGERKRSVSAEEATEQAQREREIALWRRRSLRQGSEARVPSLLDVSWGQEAEVPLSAKLPGRVSTKGRGSGALVSPERSPPRLSKAPAKAAKPAPPPRDWRDAQGSWLEQRRRDGPVHRIPSSATASSRPSPYDSLPPHNLGMDRADSLGRAGSSRSQGGWKEELGGSGRAQVERSPVSYLVKHFSGSGRMPKWYNHAAGGLSPPASTAAEARTPPPGPLEGKRAAASEGRSPSLSGRSSGQGQQARTLAEVTRQLQQRRQHEDGALSDGSI